MRKSNFLRNFWYSLSTNQRDMVRKLYYFPADFKDKITGNTHKYVPPRSFIYTGSTASAQKYLAQGTFQMDLLKKFIHLQPDDAVLDIGSGVGRTAIALTNYINDQGSYDGFDVVKKGVQWCNNRIHKDYKNFNFKYVSLYNDLYNHEGTTATQFIFPYKDASFDKIFSFSVFTHMMVDEISHYLSEIERVLKPGGMCLCTFFWYDATNEDFIATREGFNFPYKHKGYRLMNETTKYGNIALDKKLLNTLIIKAQLSPQALIEGYWKDAQKDKNKVEYQDMAIIVKPK